MSRQDREHEAWERAGQPPLPGEDWLPDPCPYHPPGEICVECDPETEWK